jgi:hypothetical protein
MGRLAVDTLVAALDDLGVRCAIGSGAGVDLTAQVDDRAIAFEIKATAYATPERVRSMIEDNSLSSATPLLVADHITEAARDVLIGAGWSWLDRRGHVYVRAPGVMIDRDIDALPRPAVVAAGDPISGAAGIAVAYATLLTPEDSLTVRASARGLGFSPSSVSNARSRLRNAGLLERDGLPVVPELFWALADVWKPERAWLVRKPKPSDTHSNVDDLGVSGWCLTGTAAAVEWGAPVAAADPLIDLYVAGPVMITIARREYEAATDPGRAKASVAVAPSSLVTSRRIPSRRKGRWPLANPLAVALDLAQDRARGREILQDWTPPPEYHRVW